MIFLDEIIFFVAFKQYFPDKINYPPASTASREIANLTERKIHKPPDRVSKNLSVCLEGNGALNVPVAKN